MQRCPDAITQYIITRLLNYVKQWFLGKYLWLCNGEHLSIISRQGPGGNGKQDDLRRSWSRYRMMLFDWEIACFFLQYLKQNNNVQFLEVFVVLNGFFS